MKTVIDIGLKAFFHVFVICAVFVGIQMIDNHIDISANIAFSVFLISYVVYNLVRNTSDYQFTVS